MNSHKFSVLIPVYNEGIVIKGTIDALLDSGIPEQDIYIVDDKSSDDTANIARSMNVNVFTVEKNGGKANAQIAALKHFQLTKKYDWIIFLDGDTKVEQNFFLEIKLAADNNSNVGLYVGQVKSVANKHIFSAARATDYAYGQDIAKHGQSNFNVIFVSPGCASVYKSTVLDLLDIDPKTLAEDMDLTMQVHRKGFKVCYVPAAQVYTQDPGNLKDYHKQVLRWYRGFWQVVKKHDVFSFKKKQKVDWYIMLITLDALIFNRIFGLIFLLLFSPALIPTVLTLDLALAFLVSCYAGYRTKRLDIIYKFPVYYWLSYVNFYAYIRSFVEIVLQKKELLAWNKVQRYNFDSNTQ